MVQLNAEQETVDGWKYVESEVVEVGPVVKTNVESRVPYAASGWKERGLEQHRFDAIFVVTHSLQKRSG